MSTLYKQNVDNVVHQNVKIWYDEKNPLVSIVILNFNKTHLTIDCLESLWEFTLENSYEIIVVDNGSSAEDFSKLVAFKGAYQLLRLEVNRYFGEGNNIGAELAKGKFLLFMNNDVTVTAGWLSPLLNVFHVHSDCGAAGPKFLYPDGSLQEAGALLDEEGESVQIGKYQDPNDPRFNQSRVVDYVSAATVLMRKTVYEDVLGFDFIYEPAYYEDVDLCLKIGQIGLKTYYIAESCVIHQESATTLDKTLGLQLNIIVESNRQKFIRRWKDYLSTGKHILSHEKKTAPVIHYENNSEEKTAAVYTPFNINLGGGERYLLSIVEYLINAGYKTCLVLPETISLLRINKIASIFNLNLQPLDITTYKLAAATTQFDLYFAMGNEIAPPVNVIGRTNFYVYQFPFQCSDEEIYRKRDWMKLYNAIIVYSDFSKKNVLKKIHKHNFINIDVEVISPPVDMQVFDPLKRKKNIISVGRFFVGGHSKQQDMMIRALRRINKLGITVELHLVGSLPPDSNNREYLFECQRLAQGLPVYFHADASERTLLSLYEDSSIYWHAAGFSVDTEESPEKCESFGISVVEAMSAGVIPIVVNNGGPASIVQHGVNGYRYESEDQLIEFTLEILFEDENQLCEIRKSARVRAHDFSKDIFTAGMKNLISLKTTR